MWIPWNSEEHAALIEVAAGRKPPSLVIRGGQVLNVFTGRLEQKDVAVSERRIAWVGPLQESGLLLDESVQIVEADGLVLVPGYIEPHAHPFQLYHPVTLAEAALVRGTTVLIHDNLFFFSCMEPEEAFRLLEAMADSPVKHFWWCRFDPQALLSAENERLYENGRVRAFLRYPAVVQAGELTDWLPLLEGDEKMAGWVREAHRLGKRVEGHAPGASYRTLSRLAAAGVTGDHESITAEEVWRRLELGYMVTLRHSSIRPDLPELIRGLADRDVPWNRLMLTTDGATPPYFRNGFTDYILRVAMEAGCPPVRAYQMVTINPAIYYRMEEHIGSLAPGRIADINLLRSLEEPTPVTVFAEGEKVAENGKLVKSMPQIDWDRFSGLQWKTDFQMEPSHFHLPQTAGPFPLIRLLNSVITKLEWLNDDPFVGSEEYLLVFLVDRGGKWMTPGLLAGFGREVDGIASSYTGSGDLLVLGRDPAMMAAAANRVIGAKGGIVWMQDGNVAYELRLPIAGIMSPLSVTNLIDALEPFKQRLAVHGHPFDDPIYTLLFLSSTHLPQVRLSARGLVRIKDRKVLVSPLPGPCLR